MESGPKELSSITVPTHVICGTKDMIRNDHTKLIACSIPGAVWKIIKGDHFIANKQAEKFKSSVAEFLETI